MIKRFDRLADGARIPFASGLTVLGPAAQAHGPARTYLRLAEALKTWTRQKAPAPAVVELWERLAFNALVGNGDDHPRNHGLLYTDGAWGLSPAFDIVPTFHPRDKVSLAMPFLSLSPSKRTAAVSAANLVRAAPAYGLPADAARARLIQMGQGIQAQWAGVLQELDAPGEVSRETKPVLDWSATVLAEAETLTAADMPPDKPKRRGWRWAP